MLLAFLLAGTRRASALATGTNRLLADALNAEERAPGALESLTIPPSRIFSRSVTSCRRRRTGNRPRIARAEAIVAKRPRICGRWSRISILVLEQRAEGGASRRCAARAGRIGGFRVHLVCDTHDHHRHERLVVTVARELLNNVAKHAGAHEVEIRCVQNPRPSGSP